MRPAAVCTAPPAVQGELVIVPVPPPPLPPVLTVKSTGSDVAVLPPLPALSLATTHQLQAPSVNPESATLQVSVPVLRVAENDCANELPFLILKPPISRRFIRDGRFERVRRADRPPLNGSGSD
jgi:hypothetical protein